MMMTFRLVAVLCVVATVVGCATGDVADVPTARRDVPTSRDATAVGDVPSVTEVDVPAGIDVPNAVTDSGVCAPGLRACPGAGCVDIQSNRANCGGCDIDCGPSRLCQNGMCTCGMGTTMCGGVCANTQSDGMNCGRCGNACPMNQMCVAGACQLNCPAPNRICMAGAMMTCVNVQTDQSNCGSCGTVCNAANATSNCNGGTCGIASCNANFGNCDGNAGNGCETTLDSVANCGGCGMACAAGPNGTPTCVGGGCGLTCNGGFANCDGNNGNGCESNTQSDAANCGACGNACGPGQNCVGGSCRAVGPMLVGQFNVNAGPAWGSNPPTYTCQEACALLFGGVAGSYQCSISNAMITRTANTSIWGVAGCPIAADTFKRGVTYNCGSANCSQSAYVSDNCAAGINYCFR